jgi:hypothetical protein
MSRQQQPQGQQQIIVRPTSNDGVREFHVVGDQIISNVPYAEFWHPMHGTENEFEALGAMGKQIAASLMGKQNETSVSRITIRPGSVRVYKTSTADWATLENKVVIPALQSVLGSNFQPVQYGSAKQRQLQRELVGASSS